MALVWGWIMGRVAGISCVFVLACCVCCCASSGASALSEGRVYEMVSPVFKGGYGAVLTAVAPDGDSVAFSSLGAFAAIPLPGTDNAYVASRQAGAGWSTTALQPPFQGSGAEDFSSTMEYALGSTFVGEREAVYMVHRVGAPDSPAEWEVAGGLVLQWPNALFPGIREYRGGSGDLCHLVLEGFGLLPETAPSQIDRLYDLSRGCGGEAPSLRLVGVRNKLAPQGEPEAITTHCEVEFGLGYGYDDHGEEPEVGENAVSADGREVFFTVNVEEGATPDCSGGVHQLFVRIGSARTLEVSRPLDPALPFGGCGVEGEVPCPGAAARASAYFKGASEDGSRVFFTTFAPLVSGDEDGKNDLYMATIGCGEAQPGCEEADRQLTSLAQVSHDPVAGQAAEVQGVVKVAPDGSRIYFVAHGVLAEEADAEGLLPVEGAENLYVYERDARYPSGHTAFVADLCSGAASSGGYEDVRCPRTLSGSTNDVGLWGAAGDGEAQTTPDGGFLVFSTYAQLIAHGPQADTDTARDVYRYDAQTGTLDRVSLGVGGYGANGNDGAFDASIVGAGLRNDARVETEQEMTTRAVSDDGSRVVFTTSEPLSPDASNGLSNVYIWHKGPGWSEGEVSLISSGSAPTNDFNPVITPDGRDVVFNTSQGLVPGDTEGDLDVYDARMEGGFPAPAVQRRQCSSEACQGPFTAPAPLLVPGSVSQAPGQNFAAPVAAKAKPKAEKRKKKRSKVKKRARKSDQRRGGR